MIVFEDLGMAFGSRMLFDQVNMTLNKGHRYGIVGANGTGKSTLLRMVMGEEEPTLGDAHVKKGCIVGWLKQDQHMHENERIIDVVMQGRPVLYSALQKKEELLTQEWTDALAEKISDIEDRIGLLGGYQAESEAAALLEGIGIPEPLHENPLSSLSGGYKLRVLLARALFENPDILLLDEPTNYLDIVTIAWLEDFLVRKYQGLLLVVSHDHTFLNRVSTDTLDFDYGEIRLYTGNYDAFIKQKEAVIEQKTKERASKEKYVAKQRAFIERFRAKPSKSKQATSREKQLERMEWPDIEHSSRRAPNFGFQQKRPSGRQVLKIEEIGKWFGEKVVLDGVCFEAFRGDKIAIVGPNGMGKSTLLKILVGDLEPDLGEFSWGYETHIGYFPQEVKAEENISMLEWLAKETAEPSDLTLKSALGKMLFSGDDSYKRVDKLSGGELARLHMAKIALLKPNILVLDEPTNHLDLESREALGRALKAYDGTVITVSHDRHFLNLFTNEQLRLLEK
ncbi:MAG: ATP-binding cassette domain-containing protein [Simkaniaceae bacterium]|nr:ATP-binding cassette domain-containing protein [Simkaniaceae bacterium]